MTNLTTTFDNDTYYLNINGQEVGFLELGEGDNSCRQIGKVEIYEDFKGKGLYRVFLTTILTIGEIEQLYSNNRNEDSNPVWNHWTNSELNLDTMCYVDINSKGELEFMVED
jgi:hypothetical protein